MTCAGGRKYQTPDTSPIEMVKTACDLFITPLPIHTVEITDHRPQTTDHRSQITDPIRMLLRAPAAAPPLLSPAVAAADRHAADRDICLARCRVA